MGTSAVTSLCIFTSSAYALSKAVKRGEILVSEPVRFNEAFPSLLECSLFLFINGNLKHVSDSHLEGKEKKESHRGEEKGRNSKYREGIAAVEKSNQEKLERPR
jgi:hypothetical protein